MKRQTDRTLRRRTAETLGKLYERNIALADEVPFTVPHWEFNLDSPLPGDARYFGTIDFRIEHMKLSDQAKYRLAMGFFTSGVVGYSKKGKGWLMFSSGAKGQPELAEATTAQIRKLPRLPKDWEEHIVDVRD